MNKFFIVQIFIFQEALSSVLESNPKLIFNNNKKI